MKKLIDATGKEWPIYHEVVDGKDVLHVPIKYGAGAAVTTTMVDDGAGAIVEHRTTRGVTGGAKPVRPSPAFNPPQWDGSITYAIEAVVQFVDMVWLSLRPQNLGRQPGRSGNDSWWGQISRPKNAEELQPLQVEALAFFEGVTPEEVGLRANLATETDPAIRVQKATALKALEDARDPLLITPVEGAVIAGK